MFTFDIGFLYNLHTMCHFKCRFIAWTIFFLSLFSGYFLEFFLVLSFAWLSILTYETYYLIKMEYHHSANDVTSMTPYRNRFYIYCGVSFFMALFILGISEIASNVPFLPMMVFKPQFGRNGCIFDGKLFRHTLYNVYFNHHVLEKPKKVFYFYIPISIGIILSIGFLVSCRTLVMKLSKSNLYRRTAYITIKNK